MYYAYVMEETTTPSLENQQNINHPDPKGSGTKKDKKKLLIIVGAVVLALIAVFVIFKLTSKGEDKGVSGRQEKDNGRQNSQNNQNGGGPSFMDQYGQNCENKDSVAFTSSPVPIEQLGQIEPMGKVEDGHVTPTDHMYVGPLNSQAADNTTDVVMPADGRVIMVAAMPTQYIGDKAQQTAPEDHRIIVSYSCKLFSIFIHVHKLSPKLQAEVGTLAPNTQKNLSLSLKAGEKIGYIGGNPVDWTMLDTSKKLTGFITPSLYSGEAWKIHTIDPFPLFTGELKQKLIAKSLRSSEPYGGKIDYDQAGKLVGNWFKAGTNGYSGKSMDRYYDGHLSIAPDYIDTKTTIVSLGNWEGKAHQFAVKDPSATPDKVSKQTGKVKYQLVKRSYMQPNGQPWTGSGLVKGITLNAASSQPVGTIMFEVMDGNKLKVESFPNKALGEVTEFTPAAQIFER